MANRLVRGISTCPESAPIASRLISRIIAADPPFERLVVSRAEAKRLFAELGEQLKVSRLDDIPPDQDITLFRHGAFAEWSA